MSVNIKIRSVDGVEQIYNNVDNLTFQKAEGGTVVFHPADAPHDDATLTSGAQVLGGYIGYGQDDLRIVGTIPKKMATTYTPGRFEQTIGRGYYLDGAQTIEGDANLLPENIVKFKTIFGVAGTATGSIDPSDATATAADILSPKTAYIADGTKATGTIQTKTGSDITSVGGIVTIPAGYYAQEYTKQGDPTGDATLSNASQLLYGITAYSQGTKYTGEMPNNGDVSSTISVQGGTSIIPAGYTSGGTVTASLPVDILTSDIIAGTAFEEATGDYAWKSTVSIPAGYHNSQTIEKTFSDVFPAPTTEGISTDLRLGKQLYNHEGKLLTGTMSEKSAATYDVSTADQTIAADQYLAGVQTIKAVTTAGLTASNIKAGEVVTVGSSISASSIASVTGTFTSDADAVASNIRQGKTAYVNGNKITGTLSVYDYSYTLT